MQDIKNSETRLKIGTRGSPLALAQAKEVKAHLHAAHPELDRIEIIVLSTKGDRVLDRPLADIGGKGLFTEEIEAALLSGEIDLAVHSLKDMPTALPDGLEISAVLEREDVRDAFISARAAHPADLPAGSVIGTASLRRQAQTLAICSDLKVIAFRGNVQSRLGKLDQNIVDATYLAMAGLKRLGISDDRFHPLETDDFLPAVAQGAICIETACHNERARQLVRPLNHPASEICVRAERAMLDCLDGSCRTPIGGYATLTENIITLKGGIFMPDGSARHYHQATGPDPEQLGQQVGQALKDMAGDDFFRIVGTGY